jgi:hypothetical protein
MLPNKFINKIYYFLIMVNTNKLKKVLLGISAISAFLSVISVSISLYLTSINKETG